jgi:hypothetical protein
MYLLPTTRYFKSPDVGKEPDKTNSFSAPCQQFTEYSEDKSSVKKNDLGCFDFLKIMQDHALNISCLLVTYHNTKIPATETILFSKRHINEHTCRVNGGWNGSLNRKNNYMHMVTAVKRFGTGAGIIICNLCVTYCCLNRTCTCPQLRETIPVTWFTRSKCRLQFKWDGTRWRTGGEVKGETGEWSG